MSQGLPFWTGAVLVGSIVSFAFPLAGLTILAVLTLDVLGPRLSRVRQRRPR